MPAEIGDQPADGMTADGLDAPKLLRLRQAIAALLGELHQIEPDSREEQRLIETVPRLLAEVGSSLPNPLLEELGMMVGPLRDGSLTGASARIVLAQVEGWVDALAMEALVTLGVPISR